MNVTNESVFHPIYTILKVLWTMEWKKNGNKHNYTVLDLFIPSICLSEISFQAFISDYNRKDQSCSLVIFWHEKNWSKPQAKLWEVVSLLYILISLK